MSKFSAARFDRQAETHDQRTGIPESECLRIARSLASLVGAAQGERLLDLGAGTGLPGAWLSRVGFRYVGLDASRTMLLLFAARGPRVGGPLRLCRADVDRPWPVADGTIGVVFSSRAAHLFQREHLVAEIERVGRPGGACVLGRVRRQSDSPRQRLRNEMRAQLRARGLEPADAGGQHRAILDALRRRGAAALPDRVAAVWQARHSAAETLAAWRSTGGLGGCELEAGVKEDILEALRRWARESLGPLDAAVWSEEQFVLEGVRLAST